MCELFALSAKLPTRVTLSLDLFSQRGGGSGPHKDGWGVAYYQGADAWILREPSMADQSPWLPLLKTQAPTTHMALSHIRLATQGGVSLANTQPFSFPMHGRKIVFSHNGHVPDIFTHPKFQPKYQILGNSDSEAVFASLLSLLDQIWDLPDSQRFSAIETFLNELQDLGPLNIQFSDGIYLFAYSNKRTQADKSMRPPGMYYLCRSCSASVESKLSGVELIGDHQDLILLASVPLSDEGWRPLIPKTLYVASEGRWIKGDGQDPANPIATT